MLPVAFAVNDPADINPEVFKVKSALIPLLKIEPDTPLNDPNDNVPKLLSVFPPDNEQEQLTLLIIEPAKIVELFVNAYAKLVDVVPVTKIEEFNPENSMRPDDDSIPERV